MTGVLNQTIKLCTNSRDIKRRKYWHNECFKDIIIKYTIMNLKQRKLKPCLHPVRKHWVNLRRWCQEEFGTTGCSSVKTQRSTFLPWSLRDSLTAAASFLMLVLNYSGSLSCCTTMNWAMELVSVSQRVYECVFGRGTAGRLMWQEQRVCHEHWRPVGKESLGNRMN